MKPRWVTSVLVIVVLVGWGCTSEPDQNQAYISGEISVADTSYNGDFSNVELTILEEDTSEADTLFNTYTDSAGTFSGTATFPEKKRYAMTLRQNDQELGQIGLILADGDSIRIEGEWPNLEETISISSREHNAMDQYQRLNRNFNRVVKAAQTGQLTGDSLNQQLHNWTDLYWEVYEENRGTMASQLSARQSIQILQGLDNQKMMDRIREVQDNDSLIDLGTTFGKNYIANNRGLDPALAYLDTLSQLVESQDKAMQIDQERIKLLYDSARVDAAKEQLDNFKETYPEESSKEWVETMNYDLTYLSPGDSIPDFQFTQNGKTISRDSLIGSPYILEITRLSNQLYQEQFDRTVVIHGIYKNYDLQVVTIPLDESQVTVDAFFEERVKPWPVADAQAFEREKLLEDFNIQLIPTRFLVDREGKIVRKYVGREYDDVIQGIQMIIENDKTKDKEPPS